MTHYKNIATILIRILAAILVFASLINSLSDWMENHNNSRFWQGFMPYLILGVGSFILSKLLATFVCFGLNKSND
jgi:hypothetical protein